MTDPKTIHEAVFNLQQEAPSIGKGTDNPFFKSKYADLPSIWDAIKPLLKKNKIYVSNKTYHEDGQDFIKTSIVFVPTGEALESVSRIMLSKATSQEYGSCMTYMRRYALSALLGIVTDEDDDGNKATQAQEKANLKKAEGTLKLDEKARALKNCSYGWQKKIQTAHDEEEAITLGADAIKELQGMGAPETTLKYFEELATGKAETFNKGEK